MTKKNKNKSASLAAKKAASVSTTKATPVEKKEEVKVEVKNEEVKPQVENKSEAKPAAKPEVKTEKVETKKEATKENKKAEKVEKPKKSEKIPVVIPEEAEHSIEKKALERATNLVNGVEKAGIPIGSTGSSVEGKAMLAYVMQQRYANNEELKKQYPELYTDLNRSIDVVTLLALVDVRQDLLNRGERGELQLQIDANQILPLQSMADMLGIKLAPAKALPGKDSQLAIDFTKSEVPEELTEGKEQAKKEVELDPEKITTEEELKAALNHLINKDKNVAESIVNTVEWYRVYRGLKETDANKKLALDEYSVTDWIDEIFTIIKPIGLLRGLGRSVYLYTGQTGSPCMAHAILHTHMSKVGWSEEQIAESLKALIKENFRYKLENDPENVKPENDKALQAVTGLLGSDYIEKLFNDFDIKTDGVESNKKAELEAARENARKVLGSIRTNYFEKEGKTATIDALRMVVGQVINLYRDPADRLAEYCGDDLIVPKQSEYPESKTEGTGKKINPFKRLLLRIGILEE